MVTVATDLTNGTRGVPRQRALQKRETTSGGHGQVRRTPFYLESQGQPIFAWLHRGEEIDQIAHGVVICPPVGYEQIHTHRALRHFADACAHAGLVALRLDYHGTGDSAGTEEDSALCAVRQRNIQDALVWMREHVGCAHITLVGLRLGATLATTVAASNPVEGLLLWAPVVQGRGYVREMRALSLTANSGPGTVGGCAKEAGAGATASPVGGDLEAAGFVVTAETAEDASHLDLLKTRPRCRRALILDRDDSPPNTRLAEHLRALEIETERETSPGYAAMMAEPQYTKVPEAAIQRAVEWLRADNGMIPTGEHKCHIEEGKWAKQAFFAVAQECEPCYYIRERTLHLGPAAELFAIISEPFVPAPQAPCIVLLNGGAAHRVGPNRLTVDLARHLASQGFRCVRLDLAGLGDSASDEPSQENNPYPATAFRDIDLTLRHLHAHLGVERVVLMGLCSGAYFAFQSAARFANPMLIESVVINPLTFHWNDGMSLESSPADQLRSYRAYMRAFLNPRKWLKVVLGRSKVGFIDILRTLLKGWKRRLSMWRIKTAAAGRPVTDALIAHPSFEDVPADLRRIVEAGRHVTFVFTRSDPGYSLLLQAAGREVTGLCQSAAMSVHFIDEADHTFSRRAPRRQLVRVIAEHLVRRYRDWLNLHRQTSGQ